jgi:hypothetical protein
MIGGILLLFMCITRLASNEIFSPSNKIHRGVGRAKDLTTPRYLVLILSDRDRSSLPSATPQRVWINQATGPGNQ